MKNINLKGQALTPHALAAIATAIETDGGVVVSNAQKVIPGTAAFELGRYMANLDEAPVIVQ